MRSSEMTAALIGSAILAAVPASAQTRPGFELGAEVAGYDYRE